MTAKKAEYSRSELVSRIRQKQLLKEKFVVIQCERVDTILYKDILELYLTLSGVNSWQWRDSLGRIIARQPLFNTLIFLLRDLGVWLFLYVKSEYDVLRLRWGVQTQELRKQYPCGLFLRTDHWFDIKSGGSVGHLRGVIDSLRSLGYQTQVVSTDHLAGIDEKSDFHLCSPIYVLGRNLPGISEILYSRQLGKSVEAYWAEWQPAFIYQRYSLGNYTGVLLKHRYRVPYVCEYNGSFVWMSRQWTGRKLLHEQLANRIELLNLFAADVVVVVSQPMKDELIARGIDAAKILVNPNGVDIERYFPTVDGSIVRTKYNLNDKVVIGFIGTFGPWHGAEVLAEAVGRLLQEHPSYREKVRLLMIGDGTMLAKVKENLALYAISDYAVLTGLIPQEQGPAHLAACDILASPHVPNPDGTPFFGSPTKLFEYMAMGKGIVASDLDQIGQVLVHNQTAWMVKPGDAVDLAAGLKMLVDDSCLRKNLGKNAHAEAVANYTWHAHTQRIIEKLIERCQ